MALDRFGAEVFLLLKRHGYPMEKLLTFGRQHLAIGTGEFEEIPGFSPISNSFQMAAGGKTPEYADTFFASIGITTTESLDASDYQACTRIHDLNEPVPESWHAGYDVVFDGGTLEHVFHFPVAMANAMNLVKPGGLLITQSPSNNLNGHGFYQFSPELLFRIFDAPNGFTILLPALVESDPPYRRYHVDDPRDLGCRVTFGGSGPLQLIMVARRDGGKAPLTHPPIQSDYSSNWEQVEKDRNRTGSGKAGTPALKGRLKNLLPTGWVRRYEQCRRTRRRRTDAGTGITRVNTLEECLRKPDRQPASRVEPTATVNPVE